MDHIAFQLDNVKCSSVSGETYRQLHLPIPRVILATAGASRCRVLSQASRVEEPIPSVGRLRSREFVLRNSECNQSSTVSSHHLCKEMTFSDCLSLNYTSHDCNTDVGFKTDDALDELNDALAAVDHRVHQDHVRLSLNVMFLDIICTRSVNEHGLWEHITD